MAEAFVLYDLEAVSEIKARSLPVKPICEYKCLHCYFFCCYTYKPENHSVVIAQEQSIEEYSKRIGSILCS